MRQSTNAPSSINVGMDSTACQLSCLRHQSSLEVSFKLIKQCLVMQCNSVSDDDDVQPELVSTLRASLVAN